MSSHNYNFALTFRPGVPDDYEAILDIQRRAYRQKEAPLYGENIPPLKETPATLADEVAGGKTILVGVNNGRVVASLRMKPLEDGSMYWGRLSVDPDLQGKGIGQRMALAVEDFSPAANGFVLDCGDRSDENMHIYSKLGYRTTGEAFQVPGGPRVLVMKKGKRAEGEAS